MTLTLEQGDDFECRNAQWLRETLCCYEPIWAAFIGMAQTGPARPLDMPGLPEALKRPRQKFYQAHYSFARKLLSLEELSKKMVDSLGQGTSYQEFVQHEDDLFRFGAYMGNIYDMFEDMAEALESGGSLIEDLKSFYNQRHHVIHSANIPHKIDADGFVKIPRIAPEKGTKGEWDTNSVWEDFKDSDFVCVAEFIEETTLEFIEAIRNCHARVFGAADRRFEGRRIQDTIPELGNSSNSPALSSFAQIAYTSPQSPDPSLPNISGQYISPSFSTQR
jgi:hypothetical protein